MNRRHIQFIAFRLQSKSLDYYTLFELKKVISFLLNHSKILSFHLEIEKAKIPVWKVEPICLKDFLSKNLSIFCQVRTIHHHNIQESIHKYLKLQIGLYYIVLWKKRIKCSCTRKDNYLNFRTILNRTHLQFQNKFHHKWII